MQLGELVHLAIGLIDKEHCPFCNGKKDTGNYTTAKGGNNSSTILREVMNNPASLPSKKPSGARPKDGVDDRQSQDDVKPSPAPQIATNSAIFSDNTTIFSGPDGDVGPVGDYGNEAHHAISGNECMKGESIENIIKNDGSNYEKETGYSINNCANGVYLPSWNRRVWGENTTFGTWKSVHDDVKYAIMKKAMEANAGQAHIGNHKDFAHEKHPISYPRFVKSKLLQISEKVEKKSNDCPLCREGNEKKSPMPAPYGVNFWLDKLSYRIIRHLKSRPARWEYFISEHAETYHKEVCRHGTVAGLPDNFPLF